MPDKHKDRRDYDDRGRKRDRGADEKSGRGRDSRDSRDHRGGRSYSSSGQDPARGTSTSSRPGPPAPSSRRPTDPPAADPQHSRGLPPLPGPPPGAPAASGSQKPPTPPPKSGLGSSSIALEIKRVLKEKERREREERERAAGGGEEEGERSEEGELVGEEGEGGGGGGDGAGKKAKHAPIVWDSPPRLGATGRGVRQSGSTSALTRIQAELESYHQQQQALDYDPDGPPAVKSSPSASDYSAVSDDERAGQPGEAAAAERLLGSDVGSSGELRGRGGGGDEDEDEEELPVPSGVMSKWATEEGSGPAEPQPKRRKGATGDAAAGLLEGSGSEGGGGKGEGAEGSGDDAAGADSGDSDQEAAGGLPAAVQEKSMLEECRSVEEFERLNKINEGTYGVVFRARDKATGRICALKKVKMDAQRDGFPLTSVREINILLSLRHDNIVNVSEVVVGNSLDSIFMVMEFVEHDLKDLMVQHSKAQASAELSELMGRRPGHALFSVAQVKTLMQQLLSGVAYLHHNWVLHRDLKTSNILYSNGGVLKICDFGLARQYGSPLEAFTHLVVTLWYRSPELLLSEGVECPRGGTMKANPVYSTAVDVWSCGCIMAELLSGSALLPGKCELEQINRIFSLLGSPTEESWPTFKDLPALKKNKIVIKPGMPNKLREKFPLTSFDGRNTLTDAGFDLLSRLLALDPAQRISAADALEHEWFQEAPRPTPKELMPTFPVKDASAKRPLPALADLQAKLAPAKK